MVHRKYLRLLGFLALLAALAALNVYDGPAPTQAHYPVDIAHQPAGQDRVR